MYLLISSYLIYPISPPCNWAVGSNPDLPCVPAKSKHTVSTGFEAHGLFKTSFSRNSDQCGSQPSNEYGHRFGGGATDSQKIIKHRSATGTIQDHPKKTQSCRAVHAMADLMVTCGKKEPTILRVPGL